MFNKILALERTDVKKPRHEGITSITDKLQPADIDNFKKIALFVDYVKIPESNLLLYSPTELERRIKFYHEYDIQVSVDSKIIEFAIMNNSFDECVRELLSFGFDIVEIEDNISNSLEDNEKIIDIINSYNFELQWKFNKRNLCNNISDKKIFERIGNLLKINRNKIVLEVEEKFSSEIFDRNINWKLISLLTSTFSQKYFVFDTSIEPQQIRLISKLGERVNLGLVDLFQVGLIEWTRRKYYSKLEIPSTENTMSIHKNILGGPSAKFIYFMIKSYHPIDQTELVRVTELPRRTIQASINDLKRQGLISESLDPNDGRKKIYDLIPTSF